MSAIRMVVAMEVIVLQARSMLRKVRLKKKEEEERKDMLRKILSLPRKKINSMLKSQKKRESMVNGDRSRSKKVSRREVVRVPRRAARVTSTSRRTSSRTMTKVATQIRTVSMIKDTNDIINNQSNMN